jgi:hypothetical protein
MVKDRGMGDHRAKNERVLEQLETGLRLRLETLDTKWSSREDD